MAVREGRASFSISVDNELNLRLEKLAKKEKISKRKLCEELIKRGLNKYLLDRAREEAEAARVDAIIDGEPIPTQTLQLQSDDSIYDPYGIKNIVKNELMDVIQDALKDMKDENKPNNNQNVG